MSKIRNRQCPSCGGNLSVDNDKQMYRCTSCGSTYDYEYFIEEKMHEMGGTYLSRGEFMAAADAFRLILEKDPHDFNALRGLMLAAAKLKDIDELVSEDISNENFSYDPKLVSEATEGASEEDKEYFSELKRLYSDKKELAEYLKEIESLAKEKRKISDDISKNDQLREECYIKNARSGTKTSPKTAFVTGWVFVGFLAASSIYLIAFLIDYGISEEVGVVVFLLIFYLMTMPGIALINYWSNYRKIKRMNEIDRQNSELYVRARETGEKRRQLEDEAERLLSNIRSFSRNFIEKDKQTVRD